MIYIAFLETNKDGTIKGWFPDINDCSFTGKSVNEAKDNARKALISYQIMMKRKGLEMPKPNNHSLSEFKENKNKSKIIVYLNKK